MPNLYPYRQDWAPTFGRRFTTTSGEGASNADLIRRALAPDADGDGVPDDVDNCPPAACTLPEQCANPNQADSDDDGYGDACDFCPNKDLYLANAPPPDQDHDGVQNACDICVHTHDPAQDDGDQDGVGDACDTCPGVPNPTRSCVVDADCPASEYGSTNYCVSRTHVCAYQNDDSDGDGRGDACDACPFNDLDGRYQLNINSNSPAELMMSAQAIDDVCDPVPIFVTEPVPTSSFDMEGACPTSYDPEATCADSLRLDASAGLGSQQYTKAAPAPTSFHAPVGFRHCDCHNLVTGTKLDYESCITARCLPVQDDYENPDSSYVQVTVASEYPSDFGGADFYPSDPARSYFTDRLFQNYGHLGPSLGPVESLSWRWKSDVEQGHVHSYPSSEGKPTTAGIFWSFALATTATASSRDAGNEQQLRSNHTYVETPFQMPFELPKAPRLEAPAACALVPCWLMLNPGVSRINPNPYDRTFFDGLRGPSLIYASDRPLLYNERQGALEAAPLLSPGLQTRLGERSTQWLAPVEAAHEVQALAGPELVAFPASWEEGAAITPIVRSGDLLHEQVQHQRMSVDGYIPPARSAPVALYSKRTRSVLMVGGALEGQEPHPSGEVWRYGLDDKTWRRVATDAPSVKKVLAAGYDSARDRMLVLDAGDTGLFHIQKARLLSLDLRSGQTKVLGEFLRTGLVDRYALTYDGDDHYLLTASLKSGLSVLVVQLRIDDASGLHWAGLTTLAGRLLSSPAPMDAGIVLPLLHHNKPELHTLTDASFGPCPGVPGVF